MVGQDCDRTGKTVAKQVGTRNRSRYGSNLGQSAELLGSSEKGG
jgi:hypothetical protein